MQENPGGTGKQYIPYKSHLLFSCCFENHGLAYIAGSEWECRNGGSPYQCKYSGEFHAAVKPGKLRAFIFIRHMDDRACRHEKQRLIYYMAERMCSRAI